MKIRLAKTAGFCMGVRRAVELVLEAANTKKGPLYTFGPLIHNPQIIDLLKQKGVFVVTDPSFVQTGTVLIRAHGAPPDVQDFLRHKGIPVVDATCPRVIKVQTIIKKYTQERYHTIIVGDENHPEVIALLGYTEGRGIVVNSPEDIPTLPAFDRAIVVAQTTQDGNLFEKIAKVFSARFPHYKIFNTICGSTMKRQLETREMAQEVDALVVVGGYTSGNTKRLAQIGQSAGVPTFHIEDAADLDPALLQGMKKIGITAGASTPTWVISKVLKAIENLPHEGKIGWRSAIHNIRRILLLSNLYVALGAGCLSFACALLLGITPRLSLALMAAFYVLSMHIMNRLTNKKAKRYNDPDRAGFDEKFKGLLLAMSICFGATGLGMAYFLGTKPFLILLIMSVMGMLYNVKILPGGIKLFGRFQKIRDIPGSKTFLIAAAWGVVTVILPALTVFSAITPSMLFVFVWISILVFIRSAIFDIVDIQGDRIVGQETLPIVFGEKQTLRLLKVLLALLVAAIPVGYRLDLVSSFGFAMLLCPFYFAGMLAIYERNWMFAGFRFEFLVESGLVLSGVIAAGWGFMGG